jgi:uncharacterized protein involved in exopolysaccharide biosynthesis
MTESTLYDYARIVNRRRGMVALTTASAIVVAFVASLLLPDVYEARSEFYVVSESQTAALVTSGGGRIGAFTVPLVTQELEKWYLGLLKSEAVRRRVSESVADVSVSELANSVDIEFTRQHIGRVRARNHRPQHAAAIANAYPPALSAFLTDAGIGRRKLSLDAIAKSLREADYELATTQKHLRMLLSAKRSPSISGDLKVLGERKATYEREVAAAKVQLASIQKRIELTVEQLGAEAKLGSGLEGSLFDSSVQRTMSEIANLESELASLRAEFGGPQGERHPKVLSLSAALAQRQRELDQKLDKIGRARVRESGGAYELYRRELAALHKDRAAVRVELAEKDAALQRLGDDVDPVQYYSLLEEELRTKMRRIEKTRDGLRVRQEESQLQAAAEALPVIMVQTAEPPEEPMFPVTLFNALVAALLGLLAGIYVAFAYDYVTRARSQTG